MLKSCVVCIHVFALLLTSSFFQIKMECAQAMWNAIPNIITTNNKKIHKVDL